MSFIIIGTTHTQIFIKDSFIIYVSVTHISSDRNWIVKRDIEARGWNGVEQIHMTGDQVAGLCEQSKELWGSIKCVEFFR